MTRDSAPRLDVIAGWVADVSPDILVLQSVDWDLGGVTAQAMADRLGYPHVFQRKPNTGLDSGLDLDKDGRFDRPRDALGYGRYTGEGGMLILSRHSFGAEAVAFTDLLWAALPWASMPDWYGAEARGILPLSHVAHWMVPVQVGERTLTLMTWHATTPVFDGPEDRNGLRNADETRLWLELLEGRLGPPPAAPYALIGNANLDPAKGDGRRETIRALLSHPALADPTTGEPTVDFARDLGRMRVSYILTDPATRHGASGIHPPWDEATGEDAPRHRLLWADITLP
ncbi:MAG: endonuclease/exonuclease/phosphatase family protein [Shimia sp.]